ncbi:hypothetical protein [Chryseobacterium sp. MP_3.2]|uniref:hypothetical protein n=1 Tax=Chryseobacterium sp. MP_3.2 TaxID=3071712 RepID=UPI002DFBE43A|nr:hypothetical protein [Chryseobacterium sp. MP_3.2]
MKKDTTEDKYKEITQELKEEKMDWDFEDFLKKTKEEEKVIPLASKAKGGSIPKTFWMAASVILLISAGVFFNYENKSSIVNQNNLVKNEILKTKDTFQQESNLASTVISDTLKVETEKKAADSSSRVEKTETEVMNQILPKRGRLKKDLRPRYAKNATPKIVAPEAETSDYESNYVIINGQKIENEQEAIDLTKYSFRILSENVSKTVAQTDVINNFNNDY